MKSVMLYFGSFNPVHKGHIAIAEYVLGNNLADELWFVVSPQNPLKPDVRLLDEKYRLEMISLAIFGSQFPDRMETCDIEFTMPRPSYTIDTLRVLKDACPNLRFSLLFGSDLIDQFPRWKEWDEIKNNYDIYIYPRSGYPVKNADPAFNVLTGAPYFDYSSTEVREAGTGGAEKMLHPDVLRYLNDNDLWKIIKK